MRKKSRTALRKAGFRLPALQVVSLRIQPDVWRRCAWAAIAKGVNRQEWIRNTLADASRDAHPPEAGCFRGLGSPGERAEWDRIAARYGSTVEKFLVYAANKAVQQLDAAAAKKEQQQ
jgi:hypothetical protein